MALRRVAVGAAMLSAAKTFQLMTSFLAIPFLARLLSPADFGLAALTSSIVFFFTMIGETGFGRSLVRVEAGDTEAWSSSFWAVSALALLLALAVVALSYPAAYFFNEPQLQPMLATVALAPLLLGITEIPSASLLQRERFQWLAGAEFLSALFGIIIALLLAFSGAGAWALVWQLLTQRITKTVILFPASGFRPHLQFHVGKLAEHIRFALDTISWSIVSYLSRQSDTLIVGKFLGPATLGLYNVAMRVAQLPVNVFGSSLNSAIYPRLVEIRDDKKRLRAMVIGATAGQAAFVFPPVAAIAASGESFFRLLLSEQWTPSGQIFALLATAMAVQTVVSVNGSVLQAIGKTGARLLMTLEFAIIWVIAAIILSQISVDAVALGCSVLTLLYLPRLLQLYLKPIDMPAVDFLRALAAPTAVAFAIVLVHEVTVLAVPGMSDWEQVGLAVIESAIGYVALIWVNRKFIGQIRKMLAA